MREVPDGILRIAQGLAEGTELLATFRRLPPISTARCLSLAGRFVVLRCKIPHRVGVTPSVTPPERKGAQREEGHLKDCGYLCRLGQPIDAFERNWASEDRTADFCRLPYS